MAAWSPFGQQPTGGMNQPPPGNFAGMGGGPGMFPGPGMGMPGMGMPQGPPPSMQETIHQLIDALGASQLNTTTQINNLAAVMASQVRDGSDQGYRT